MSETKENVEFLSIPMYKSRMSLFEVLPILKKGVVFVGDSLTQRNHWQEFFPAQTVLNRGIDSDRSLGVLSRLDHIVSLEPRKIFLMIGINDINDKRDIERIQKNYEAIILRIKSELPATELYIQSVLPVNNSVYNHPINNKDVKTLNMKLAELAERNTVKFIDIYPHVLKENELDEKYTVDGCHLSGQGYAAWIDFIKEYVNEIV
ncbi:GDSL-type esterase/lipase family protein [Lederbergia wuyishanensis]|uniref:Lysophospholipase L1-like esterase n=1 Tax=Lederbergia wuyishanensis TaxID=1347903 RepID=A0ABU0D666_9BACI|nr:GDSL-type esterase/lipase family protein [Lederbergia wuyishanensis]MCJ8008686.1 GDSL-type esterase/lipase family protein [Lederbergia wuyishanensis]MDQ0343895.1 lysophospholipase L1-like esterase [Lederbergia wuyishanensis]